MDMTPERWAFTRGYLADVFGREDGVLTELKRAAQDAGLPDIAVSADVGRLLSLLTSLTPGMLAIEVGTLAGYSGIWLARGLRPGGKLITLELDEKHADFAEQQFARAGLAAQVEVRRGAALEQLPRLAAELGPRSVDVAFIDADKREYPAYFAQLRPLIKPGGLFLADNVLGSSSWWIDQEGSPYRAGADALNRQLAADPGFEAVAVPSREGVLIARRR